MQNGLVVTSPEQRQNLKIATLGFYFLLPDFEKIISKYINIDIDKKQLISDIQREYTKIYQNASKKSKAEIDEYSDDYEEPVPIEIFILDVFDNATSDRENLESLTRLFTGIIDTLDYYENFSDEPEYWNNLLEKEITLQNEILTTLKKKETFDTAIYQKRYGNVEFNQL